MKHKKFILKTLVSSFALPSTINFFIFKNANFKKSKVSGKYYDWKYGKIFYNIKGNGTPLLMVHRIGIGESSLEWQRNINTLSKYYKVYSIDLIGFGQSDKPNMTYTAYLYSQLIIDFIKDIIKESTNIIADSLSSAFVIMAYTLSSVLFNKIMLICPSGVGNINTHFSKHDKYTKMVINFPIIGTTLYNYISSKKFCKKILEDELFFNKENITTTILNEYYYSAHYKGANSRYSIASFISNYMNVNIEISLQKVVNPIYIVWGKNSVSNPVSNLELIKNLNKNINYAIFNNSKAMPHLENAREFNNICIEFFK